ncbi:MAG: glyoxalase/bleomycin resistance/extradiol dioxygenase family protein [Actinomycetales bacterium]|nr:glyoxalase/bleomycin resistance/extradiol dioxygenase family protein [Actinomycetales bacterium]
MSRLLFVNMSISDATASRAYFSTLGFGFNETFCDEHTLCLEINDSTWAMLLEEARFQEFLGEDRIVDTSTTREVLLAISADSREAVDEFVTSAVDAGGKPWGKDQDYGFMYSKSFTDLDHHVWEVVWMDPRAAQDGPPDM